MNPAIPVLLNSKTWSWLGVTEKLPLYPWEQRFVLEIPSRNNSNRWSENGWMGSNMKQQMQQLRHSAHDDGSKNCVSLEKRLSWIEGFWGGILRRHYMVSLDTRGGYIRIATAGPYECRWRWHKYVNNQQTNAKKMITSMLSLAGSDETWLLGEDSAIAENVSRRPSLFVS